MIGSSIKTTILQTILGNAHEGIQPTGPIHCLCRKRIERSSDAEPIDRTPNVIVVEMVYINYLWRLYLLYFKFITCAACLSIRNVLVSIFHSEQRRFSIPLFCSSPSRFDLF